MNQAIIKNIGIMRQLIEIGDTETLSTLTQNTQKADETGTFKYLWQAIANNRLDDALIIIEDTERQSRAVATHYDPIVSALKVELRFQENELTLLLADRDDMAKKVNHFQIKYHHYVNPYLERMLYLRKEKLTIQARMDNRLKAQAEEAETEYRDFYEAFTSPIKGVMYTLNEADLKEIKMLYRRASMICHPDRVADKDKERAQEMFAELHEAYQTNDLQKVRLITELLEKTGEFEPNSQRLETSDALKARINWVMLEKEAVEEDVKAILVSSAYLMIEQIGEDWDSYFMLSVENIKNQISDLEKWHLLQSNQN